MQHRRTSGVLFLLLAAASLAGCATEGADDRAEFTEGSAFSPVGTLAVGGATSVGYTVAAGTTVAKVTSSDTSVLTVTQVTANAATVQGLKAGSVTLTLLDSSGAEIDHTTLSVAAIAGVYLTTPSEAMVLEGATFQYVAFAYDGAGHTLDGVDVQYSFEGSIAAASSARAICLASSCPAMVATAPGDGELIASAGGVSATFLAHVVPIAAIDSFTFEKSTETVAIYDGVVDGYTLEWGGTRVFSDGAEIACTSSNPAVATPDLALGAGLGSQGSTAIQGIDGVASGTATITCTVGALSAAVAVTVP
jgi:hypothetical protein